MVTELRYPLLVAESGDLDVYASADDATDALEAMDVRDGIFDIFDSSGRTVVADLDGHAVVGFRVDERLRPDPERYLAVVKEFMIAAGPSNFAKRLEDVHSLEEAARLVLEYQAPEPKIRRKWFKWRG